MSLFCWMSIFDGRDYTRKICLELYFHCGPFKKIKMKLYVTDIIRYKNLTAICLQILNLLLNVAKI